MTCTDGADSIVGVDGKSQDDAGEEKRGGRHMTRRGHGHGLSGDDDDVAVAVPCCSTTGKSSYVHVLVSPSVYALRTDRKCKYKVIYRYFENIQYI